MPRTPVDYSRIVIYKIVCNDLSITELYVGSTTDFTRRKSEHKYACKTENSKIYSTIRANGNWENWSMVEIEKFPCVDGNEARSRERHWMEELNAKLNMYRPIISADDRIKYTKEYNDTHKEQIKERCAEYNETHKEQKADYYETHKELIKERQTAYIKTHKELIKAQRASYYETHKEQRAEQSRDYYQKNKEKILERKKVEYQKNKI